MGVSFHLYVFHIGRSHTFRSKSEHDQDVAWLLHGPCLPDGVATVTPTQAGEYHDDQKIGVSVILNGILSGGWFILSGWGSCACDNTGSERGRAATRMRGWSNVLGGCVYEEEVAEEEVEDEGEDV